MALRRLSGVFLLLASLPVSAASTIICCNDERGKQVCGDILPTACIGRAYREINHTGMVVRNVEAPLTPEQKAQRAAEEKRKQEAEDAAREQRRMDAALMQTYSSEADIDLMQQRAEDDVHKAVRAAQAKIDEARKARKKFENEAEFYKKKTLPAEVDKGLKDADYEIRAQEELIASKAREMELIKAKYDEDRRRFRDLKNRMRKQ